MDEPGVWTARVIWVLMPFTAGPCLAAALDPTAHLFRTVASVVLWLGWAAALGVSLVPRSVSLTAVRTLMPGALAATAWAALALPHGVAVWKPTVAVAWSALALAACLSPLLGDAFVNGSSYGPERRMPLRVPGSLLVVIPVTWVLALAGATSGILLVADRLWIVGGLCLVAGLPLAFVCVRSMHAMARRWVVFVPAGFVLHDQFGLPEAVLFPLRMIRHLGPAPADTDALDETQGSPGLALLLELTEPLTIGVRSGRSTQDPVETQQLVFTPTRPGALLDEARRRRINVD